MLYQQKIMPHFSDKILTTDVVISFQCSYLISTVFLRLSHCLFRLHLLEGVSPYCFDTSHNTGMQQCKASPALYMCSDVCYMLFYMNNWQIPLRPLVLVPVLSNIPLVLHQLTASRVHLDLAHFHSIARPASKGQPGN